MISKNFENELKSLFTQNGSDRLYDAQFRLFTDRLKEEYALLNSEKMRLYQSLDKPDGHPKIAKIDARIGENRAEIMKLYQTSVSLVGLLIIRF
jgi:hypothetical protein